jgi:protocatechuate 3,4-dioxygenase beta subunit
MLEDGSYAVTDRDGRYHFEGVCPAPMSSSSTT